MNEQVLTYCKDLLEDTELLNSLNESKFELVYTEANDICAPGIFQILGIKNVVLAVAHTMMPRMYEVTGMSTLPSFMPEIVTPFSDDMTFVERMANFKISMQFMFHMRKWERIFWEHFNAKYPGFPAIREIYNEKTALIMTNVHEFAESPRPTTNMIRYIGGSTLYEAKPLEKDLDDLLNEREATVLFSLGSVAKSKNMPEWLRNADKRLSLFITHGGMNSMLEAMHYGKPVIVIPLFGDQLHNSRNIPRLQIGNILDRTRISQKTLTEMIKKTLGNETILRNAAFVASQLAGRPQQYREDIARWAKVILEYGRMDHLILHSRNMNSIHIVAFKTGILLYKSL
ncbi:glycosyltransferase family 28 protein [Necator americanus]|uniref:glucuronosyltransferase n=1 Tax=Necator americanus TaxID=51031 RepID=W2TTE5_NECAM|nr:glycosyltransferase family 28 protein [Necator americanus]ETN85063.1 glycosyltransferase family 28 protein [Necator americanus]